MDQSLVDVLNRLNEIERELSELKLWLAATSAKRNEVEGAVRGYVALREEVSQRWSGGPSVLDEFRKSRRHEYQS